MKWETKLDVIQKKIMKPESYDEWKIILNFEIIVKSLNPNV